MITEEAVALIYDLKRARTGKHERPHKPVLLLAVMDLIERGDITDNRTREKKREKKAGKKTKEKKGVKRKI